jgi:hypothetical protein
VIATNLTGIDQENAFKLHQKKHTMLLESIYEKM